MLIEVSIFIRKEIFKYYYKGGLKQPIDSIDECEGILNNMIEEVTERYKIDFTNRSNLAPSEKHYKLFLRSEIMELEERINKDCSEHHGIFRYENNYIDLTTQDKFSLSHIKAYNVLGILTTIYDDVFDPTLLLFLTYQRINSFLLDKISKSKLKYKYYYKWLKGEEDLEDLFNGLVSKEIIDPETEFERFKKVFSKIQLASEIEKIDWLHSSRLLAYFIIQSISNKFISKSPYKWKIAELHFTNSENLAQSADQYLTNQKEKPKKMKFN